MRSAHVIKYKYNLTEVSVLIPVSVSAAVPPYFVHQLIEGCDPNTNGTFENERTLSKHVNVKHKTL